MKTYPSNPPRRGMTILEAAVALTFVAAGLVATAQVFALCARQRLAGEQLLTAQFEAANVLEHIAALQYADLTSDAVGELKLSPESQSTLPGGQLHVTLSNSPSTGEPAAPRDPPHKRVRVEVLWWAEENPPSSDGEPRVSQSEIPDHSVVLTAWRFAPPQEAAP